MAAAGPTFTDTVDTEMKDSWTNNSGRFYSADPYGGQIGQPEPYWPAP